MKILMCRPTYFEVAYSINAWMDTSNPVDPKLAMVQWRMLREKYEQLGFEIEEIEPVKGLPDMVFTANGALVIDGRVALPRFRYAERQPETAHFRKWFEQAGYKDIFLPKYNFEGEGDALVLDGKILAGWGFRSDLESHAELAEFFDREIVSLHLVNDRFYHIDTCLSVLSERAIAFYPGAFDEESVAKLRRLVPLAIEVGQEDAEAFGINSMSDSNHVVCSDRARGFHQQLLEAGFTPLPTPIGEFQKSGGGVKCLTLPLRD